MAQNCTVHGCTSVKFSPVYHMGNISKEDAQYRVKASLQMFLLATLCDQE